MKKEKEKKTRNYYAIPSEQRFLPGTAFSIYEIVRVSCQSRC